MSSSITQSALPAVSPFFASNKNLLAPDDAGEIVKVNAVEVPPLGVLTVTLAVPAVATFAAGMVAVNDVELT